VGIVVNGGQEVILTPGATASDARRALAHLPQKGRLLERLEFRRRFYAIAS
jgi:uncharacterized repeat protein (TIGR03917 family)